MTQPRFAADLSLLPTHGYGPRSTTWWGTLGFVAIEATVFVLAAGTYLYLMAQADQWPPNLPPPDLTYATIFTVVLLVSELPNVWLKRVAEREEATKSRIALVVLLLVGFALLAIRVFEFGALNCRWDDNAYGSIVWTILGLHTFHLATDIGETVVLTVLAFVHEVDGRRFGDFSDDAVYWHFVVAAWLPIYVLLYWVPRLG